jgi:uncharacterized protein YyaL (SSP411 family)
VVSVNRLAQSTSPYLLQHADNPVDWWPWSEQAFAEARARDVPVLLSVGYAACHWCHVMAHESFEDPITAQLMNEHFVNIKVDREERPDVDAVYMEATQAMSGHGGWPMTVVCTPDAKPFFAGTYFPPTPRHGMPAFRQVLASLSKAWRERRDEIESVGAEVVRRLTERSLAAPETGPPTAEELAAAARLLAQDFDWAHAGFGGAPKFPPSMTLEHLLRHHARTGSPEALRMASATCEAMARGGMYDQLGGGFARYSVDAEWVVPHFEKMLYDNALLLRVYPHLWRATGSALARRVTLEIADWMLRDLRTAEGGFASALDADSEGVEGKYYVWTPDQLREVLGAEDAAYAASVLGVTDAGTFEHGTSVLQLRADPDDGPRYERIRAALLDARNRRVPPGRDDKVVAAWNGLAIAALAEAGTLFDRPDLVDAAVAAASLLIDVHLVGGRLLRTSRNGKPGPNAGVLEDYGDVAEGLQSLYAVTGDERWLRVAGELLDAVLARFPDGRGGFFDTADDAERLVRRPQDPADNATPSGQSAAAGALLSYAAYTGSARHRDAAECALGVVRLLATRYPRAAGWGLAVAEALADGPREVAIVGSPDDPATHALRRTAFLGTAPGAVIAVGDPARPADVALLRDRPLVGGRPAAYVCRHFVCDAPTTDPAQLAAALGAFLPVASEQAR